MGDILLNLIALAASLIAIYEFSDSHPWVVYAAPLAFAAIVVAIFHRRLFAYWILRRNLSRAHKLLFDEGIRPSLIVAFDRSSGIYAGMLAQRIALSSVLGLPRTFKLPSSPSKAKHIVIGEGVMLDPSCDLLDNPLILVFHLRTGATLDAGLEFFRESGIQFQGRIIVIYGTRGATARWPQVLCVNTITQNVVPNEEFPWMHREYPHA
jgi:hypothetical protein